MSRWDIITIWPGCGESIVFSKEVVMGGIFGGGGKSETSANPYKDMPEWLEDAFRETTEAQRGAREDMEEYYQENLGGHAQPDDPFQQRARQVARDTQRRYSDPEARQRRAVGEAEGAYRGYEEQAARAADRMGLYLEGDYGAGIASDYALDSNEYQLGEDYTVAGNQAVREAHMNPYLDEVVAATEADMARDLRRRVMERDAQFAQAGAVAGSRAAVAEALASEAHDRALAREIGALRAQGFEFATEQSQRDLQRRMEGDMFSAEQNLQADLANQELGQEFAMFNAAQAMEADRLRTERDERQSLLYENLGEGAFDRRAETSRLYGDVATDVLRRGEEVSEMYARRGAEQRIRDTERARSRWDMQREYADAVSSTTPGAPYGQGTTTRTSDSGWGNFLGSVGMAAGIAALAASDERIKENVDEEPEGNLIGLKPKTYNYVGDDSGERHLGLMAQEIEERLPTAVVEIDTPDGLVKHVKLYDVVASNTGSITELAEELAILKASLNPDLDKEVV